jgi:hypothetical protein
MTQEPPKAEPVTPEVQPTAAKQTPEAVHATTALELTSTMVPTKWNR